jgi:two-component system, NtrC family, sensor kinase
MAQIIRQLLDFARKRTPERAHTDLRVSAGKVVELLTQLAEKRGVKLACVDGPACVVMADDAQIQQVLINVVSNAIQACQSGGLVTIDVAERRKQPPRDVGGPVQSYACIEVRDNGIGMEPTTMARVFEPFFTTKDVGEGTGLGLSVAYGIVREHGGFISVDSRLGAGSTFGIYLPNAAEETKT